MLEVKFKRHLRYEGEREERDCPTCGKPLSLSTRLHAKYCSEDCQRRGWYSWAKKQVTCTCKHCGKEFRARDASRQYCGNSCHMKARYAAGLFRPPVRRPYLTAARFDAAVGV